MRFPVNVFETTNSYIIVRFIIYDIKSCTNTCHTYMFSNFHNGRRHQHSYWAPVMILLGGAGGQRQNCVVSFIYRTPVVKCCNFANPYTIVIIRNESSVVFVVLTPSIRRRRSRPMTKGLLGALVFKHVFKFMFAEYLY